MLKISSSNVIPPNILNLGSYIIKVFISFKNLKIYDNYKFSGFLNTIGF